MKITKEKVLSNLIWRFFERCGSQVVTIIVSIILARMLEPEMYGTIAITAVFTTVLSVFIDCGIGAALVQKKNADQLDYSTVFYFNILTGILFYLILFFCAPVIAVFYDNSQLSSIIRIVSISLIFGGINNVQLAYIGKNLLFKKVFFVTMIASCVSAIVGISMAYLHYGVWALVFQSVTSGVATVVCLWLYSGWRPTAEFSIKRLKGLYRYGWKLLVSALLETIYVQISQLLIGKIYSLSDLAQYNRGEQIPSLIVSNIDGSINSVLFPALSNEQENITRIREMTRRAIKTSAYVIMPCMVGIAVCAEPLVCILLTDKWLPCVIFIRVFCFIYAFYPIHTANLNAIKALGRSDIFLKLEIIKKLLGLVTLLITIPISVKAIAIGLLFNSVASQIINSYPNKKLLNYSYLLQIRDLVPVILASIVMGIIVYMINFIGCCEFLTLTIQILTGVFIYILSSVLIKIDSFYYLKETIRNLLKGVVNS